MTIFHTSPVEIKEIKPSGMFGDCLFFSNDVYVMTASSTVYVYSMEIEDEEVISVKELYDEEIIKRICEKLEVEEDDAERMLDGRDNAFDHGKDGEDDWWIQRMQGECAKKMGYRACEAFDEQGTVYIIPMLGRESELTLEEIR